MKKILSGVFTFLLMASVSFAQFGGQPFGGPQLPNQPLPFGSGGFGGPADGFGEFNESLTFLKRYDINQGTLDADKYTGSPTATFTRSSGATTPATTIETQAGNALLFDETDDVVAATAVDMASGGSIRVKLRASNSAGNQAIFTSVIGGTHRFVLGTGSGNTCS